MFTIVGLGNPGKEYEKTRHNVGRIILSQIAKKNDFSQWKTDMKTKSLQAIGKQGKQKILFVFPETFMNNSGLSIKPLIKSKNDLEKLVVVYDDLDLPIGTIKISYNRSSGGHNGLESIIKNVKSEAFTRVRVGVSPVTPSGKLKKPKGEKAVVDFLLKDFRENEITELKKVSKKIDDALTIITNEGRLKAMTLYN
jgi:PTH1 family peptidyl-tRNA hydrolase